MTYLREAGRLLQWAAAVAIAGAGFLTAPVQAANVTFSGCTSGAAYTNVQVDASGNFTITCQAQSAAGTIAFGQNAYSGNTSSTVAISLTRTGGSTGAASSSVSVTNGGCTVSPGSVQWADGDAAPKSATVTTTPGPATCTISGNAVTTSGSTTIQTTVNVVDPNQPGTFAFSASQSGPTAGGSNFTFQITRSGGSNGAYDVAFTATPTGLTGASIVEASPIRFNAGETTKNLTLVPGSTAGSMLIHFVSATPVAPNTTATTVGADITINVTNQTTGCPATPSNVIILPDIPQSEGAWILANADQGKIASAKLPVVNPALFGGVLTQTSTQGTGPITRIEMAISKCPGDFTYYLQQPRVYPGTTYYPCYTSSSFITNNSLRWHLTVGNHFAYCYAPTSDGPWYINMRYEMPNGCPYGSGNCGASVQWNRP